MTVGCQTPAKKYSSPAAKISLGDCQGVIDAAKKLQAKEPVLSVLHQARGLQCLGEWDSAGHLLESARESMLDFTNPNKFEAALASTLASDLAIRYTGDALESLHLRLLRGIGFMATEQWAQAANDFRGGDSLIQLLKERYRGQKEWGDSIALRVLAATTHQMLSELGTARSLWARALSILRDRQGEEILELQNKLNSLSDHSYLSSHSVVIALLATMPSRQERVIAIPAPSLLAFLLTSGFKEPVLPWGNAPLKVKVPVLPKPQPVSGIRGSWGESQMAKSVLLESLWEQQFHELERTSGERGLRVASRLVTKFLGLKLAASAAERSRDQGLRLVGAVGNLTSSILVNLTERADIRSWDTLPAAIHLLVVPREAGVVRLQRENREWLWHPKQQPILVIQDPF